MAGRLAWCAFRNLVKNPCLLAWDYESAEVPRRFLNSLPGMIYRIRGNMRAAGFGPDIQIAAFGNHEHSVNKRVLDSFERQRVCIRDTPFQKADDYVAAEVDLWKSIHPQGGSVVLFSADRGLGQRCSEDGNPLFDFYLAATPDAVARDYFNYVTPRGGWIWPEVLRRGATMYPSAGELKAAFERANRRRT